MLIAKSRVENRPEFNLTSASTLHHLIAVALACAGLWTLIMVTVGT
ncbi:MAG: hypothetical protein ACPGOV_02160 [Magnetovibrionaceae bacterium]